MRTGNIEKRFENGQLEQVIRKDNIKKRLGYKNREGRIDKYQGGKKNGK